MCIHCEEVVAKMRAAKEAAPGITEAESEAGVKILASGVKVTPLAAMPYAGRRTVWHGPPIGDPNYFPRGGGQQLLTIDNKPDPSSCPVVESA